MPRRMIAFALSFLAVLSLSHRAAIGGQITTPLQTATIPMTSTNWGPATFGGTNPLNFKPFDPSLGTLDSVALTLSLTVRNDYLLIFPNTPTPTKLYLATTQTRDPSVLSNPILVQQLTDGPSQTLLAPDHVTQLIGGAGARVPVDVVSLTEPAGTWSSTLPVTDPHFIAPSVVTLSLSLTLNASQAALLKEFIGTHTINLPDQAVANSSFYSSSGNGAGLVRTSAGATVTVQYMYTPFSIPEPSGLILLGLGAGLGILAVGRGRRAARPAVNNRT